MVLEQNAQAARAVGRLAKVAERAVADAGLSLAQYRLLGWLVDGTAAAAVLAERLAVSRPTVTALVDGLVERGLVRRESDPTDRRRVSHVLTDAGRAALDEAHTAIQERLEKVAAHLKPADASRAMDALLLWDTALDLLVEAKVAEQEDAPDTERQEVSA